MAITPSEKEELIQGVINELAKQSTNIDSLPTVSSLDQTDSLPAYKRDTTDLVRVPIPLIAQPATEAAEAANLAASAASNAAQEATQAVQEATEATSASQSATSLANAATERVNQAMDTITEIENTANDADTLSKELKSQLNNYKIASPTEDEYANLATKDDNTLYFCTENEETI